jgi:hypothetical protein
MQSWPEFIMLDKEIPIFGSYGLLLESMGLILRKLAES